MQVEVWDELGPRCYVELSHPLPTIITLPVKQRGAVLVTAGGPRRQTLLSPLQDRFQLYALHDHDLRMLTPVYVRLREDGTSCQV